MDGELSSSVTNRFGLRFQRFGDFFLGEGNGTPLQYSRLENPMDGGAWWAAVHGVAKSWNGAGGHPALPALRWLLLPPQACGCLRPGSCPASSFLSAVAVPGGVGHGVVMVVQALSGVRLFATLWTAARQASLSFTISRSLLELMSIESVMPSNHLIFCRPLLPPSVFPSVKLSQGVKHLD